MGAIREQIERGNLSREAQWTEGLAIGSEAFVNASASTYKTQRRFVFQEVVNGHDSGPPTWVIREAPPAYSVDSGRKIAF